MIRIGNGFDVHKFAEGRELWLCGVKVDHSLGLLGHSDADVALHALCDALLGAAALRDIGYHFPDTDPAYKGADSRRLLRRVVELIAEKGYRPGNVDVTIIAQAPKLLPYIERMRATVASDLGIDPDCVSVKATTTERLGFTGRGEGIAAQASALIVPGSVAVG
ncbi:MAG: 2-C-methyl-D-erythritol 2,4-cyclodiphosphate synthase [Muribaculaceae bacterium]|nr:2-C-methyl-D-erythritol 2,4-cyclodiphosphate synthase [Bacteroides sp.]MDE6262052.1 2-C-methyl-D-erythritol 2,4-cyclodiphosphate synthase [Muribaculaceae bacterium]